MQSQGIQHPPCGFSPPEGDAVTGSAELVDEALSPGYGSAKLPTMRERVIAAMNFMVTRGLRSERMG